MIKRDQRLDRADWLTDDKSVTPDVVKFTRGYEVVKPHLGAGLAIGFREI